MPAADSDDDAAAILGSTQFEPGPADYDDDSADKLWDAIAILDERKGQYLVDWAGVDEHGKPWEPSWTLKTNCTDALIAAWKKKKEAKAGKRKSRSSKGPASRRSSTSAASTKSKRTQSPARPKVKKEMYIELPPSPTQQRKRKASALDAPDDAEQPPAKRRATRSSAPTSANGRSSKLDDAPAASDSNTKLKRGRQAKDDEEQPKLKRGRSRQDDGEDASKSKRAERTRARDVEEDEAPPPKAPRIRKDAKDILARTSTGTKSRRGKDKDNAQSEREDDEQAAPRKERKILRRDEVAVDDQAAQGAKSRRRKGKDEVQVEVEVESEDDQAEAEVAATSTKEPLFLPDTDSDALRRRPVKKYGGSRASRQRDRETEPERSPTPEPPPKTKQKKAPAVTAAAKSKSKPDVATKSKSKKALSPELGASRSPSPAPAGVDEELELELDDEEEDAGEVFNRRLAKSKSKQPQLPLRASRARSKSKAKAKTPSPPPAPHKVTFDVGQEEEEEEEEEEEDAFNRHPSKPKSNAPLQSTPEPTSTSKRPPTPWHSPGQPLVDRAEADEERDTWLEDDDDVMAGMHDDFVAPGAGDGEEDGREEEDVSEYKPTQTQSTSTASNTTAIRTADIDSPDKLPTQSTDATDASTRSAGDDDSYRPSQTQDVSAISEVTTQNGRGKANAKTRELKPVPYVSPSKFTPLLPPPSSQIEEFTPSPERKRGADAAHDDEDGDDDEEEDEDEDERIGRRGQALADAHARREKERSRREKEKQKEEREKEKKVAWADVMEAAATIDNINEQAGVVDADVDLFINWDAAAAPVQSANSQEREHEQDSSIVEETPLSQQGLLGARAAPAPVIGLQDQLRNALELLQKRSLELASTKARLAEMEQQAAQPQPQPQPEPPAPLRVDAAVATDGHAGRDVAVATEAETADAALQNQKIAELEETLKQHKQTVASLRSELDALTSVSRDAIDAASRLGKENAALSASNAILQSQATHGVAQARLLGEAAARELEGEVARWRALAELLQAQAARTDDSVRAKAAKYDILQSRVAELEEELGGQRRLVDDLGARYASARDELEEERQREVRCTWFVGPTQRCGEVLADRQAMRRHWIDVHAMENWHHLAPSVHLDCGPTT